ncbi:hypothetical protein VTO42DRAFT_6980 [Malbranchea cinnamomea]
MAAQATTVAQTQLNLSSNDSRVLQALFDAESSPSPASSAVQTDASLPPLPHVNPSNLQELQAREVAAIRPLNTTSGENEPKEQQQQQQPSQSAIESAINNLSSIIESHPNYASAYVNRAQALRMLIDSDMGSPKAADHCAQLLNDLSKAITLLSPSLPTFPVSPLAARILSNAHTHRAYLLFRASRSKRNRSDKPETAVEREEGTETGTEVAVTNGTAAQAENGVAVEPPEVAILPPNLRSLSADALEEMASYDFQQGGRYGNPIAKQLAVHTNPYAKMCGAIVRDAMRAEIEEWLGTRGLNGEANKGTV